MTRPARTGRVASPMVGSHLTLRQATSSAVMESIRALGAVAVGFLSLISGLVLDAVSATRHLLVALGAEVPEALSNDIPVVAAVPLRAVGAIRRALAGLAAVLSRPATAVHQLVWRADERVAQFRTALGPRTTI